MGDGDTSYSDLSVTSAVVDDGDDGKESGGSDLSGSDDDADTSAGGSIKSDDDDLVSIRETLHIFDVVFHGCSNDQITTMLDDDDRKDWEDLNDLRLALNHRKRLRKQRWQHE